MLTIRMWYSRGVECPILFRFWYMAHLGFVFLEKMVSVLFRPSGFDLFPIASTTKMRSVTVNSWKVVDSVEVRQGENCKTKGCRQVHFDGTVVLHHPHFTNEWHSVQLAMVLCSHLCTFDITLNLGSNKSSDIVWKMKSLKKYQLPSRNKVWKMHACARSWGPLRSPGRSGRVRFPLLLKFGNCGNLWKWIGLDLRLSWHPAQPPPTLWVNY